MSRLMMPGLMHRMAVILLVVSSAPTLAAHRASARSAVGTPTSSALRTPMPHVLFSGRADEIGANWIQRSSGGPAHWRLEDGAMVATDSDIFSREKFMDFELHVEFRVPYMPNAHGQERGNSGVFLQGRYEIQVLDSYGLPDPGRGDCGAVYGLAAPLVNACKPPLQWQSFDIVFRAPRVSTDHHVVEPGRVTIKQNGIVVQNNQVIERPTGAQIDNEIGQAGPILLQFHGYPVAFRNVWVVPLPNQGANHY